MDPAQTYLRVAASRSPDAAEVENDLVAAMRGFEPTVLLLFAGGGTRISDLSSRLLRRYPDALIAGCTTCGEIGPDGITSGAVSALALAAPARASACLVEDLDRFRFEDGKAVIQELQDRIGVDAGTLAAEGHDFVLLTLTDGLSGMEEILITSLATYAPGVPLIGGSAADDFKFERTCVTVQEKTAARSAAVILVHPGMPFHVFHTHHYTVCGGSLVVTGADPARRLIHRIDGRPAVEVLAELLDIPLSRLLAHPVESLSKRQAIFGVGSRSSPFLRSVMGIQDQSLLMGGAVEEGSILYPMDGGDLVESTREALQLQIACVPAAIGMMLFNCGGRLLEAQSKGVVMELGRAMTPIPASGFTTYGEQFGSMQVNHTLTGVVFGDLR